MFKIVRFSSCILALVMLFGLIGCGEEKGPSSEEISSNQVQHSVDVAYFAKRGQIPELPIKLGSSVDIVIAEYDTLNSQDESDLINDDIINLETFEGEQTVKMVAGQASYFYEIENQDNGIAVLVNFDNSYDFEIGISMVDDVENAIEAEGTISDPTIDEMFFFPLPPEGCKKLNYQMDAYNLEFYFVDDFLSATVLKDSANWNISYSNDNDTQSEE